MVWAQVANAGVWIDGATRVIVRFRTAANSYIQINRTAVNNQLEARYRDGAGIKLRLVPTSTLLWFPIVETWSVAANEVRVYLGGAQIGAPLGGLGVWAGNFTVMSIGDWNNAPFRVWDGNLAHAAVWDRPLTPAEVAALAVV